jgi:hypothetical protein
MRCIALRVLASSVDELVSPAWNERMKHREEQEDQSGANDQRKESQD